MAGNVRQLFDLVKQHVALSQNQVMSEEFVENSLGDATAQLPSYDEARDEFSRDYLVKNLQSTRGNVSQSARLAKRNRTNFYQLLSRYRLQPDKFKGKPGAGVERNFGNRRRSLSRRFRVFSIHRTSASRARGPREAKLPLARAASPECHRMASSVVRARPSWRKVGLLSVLRRYARPHSGAVRQRPHDFPPGDILVPHLNAEVVKPQVRVRRNGTCGSAPGAACRSTGKRGR